MHGCMRIHTHTWMHAHSHAYMDACIQALSSLPYTIHTHTGRQADRQPDRQVCVYTYSGGDGSQDEARPRLQIRRPLRWHRWCRVIVELDFVAAEPQGSELGCDLSARRLQAVKGTQRANVHMLAHHNHVCSISSSTAAAGTYTSEPPPGSTLRIY